MLILGIDTTEKNINIALTENNILLSEIEEVNPKNEEIINLINKVFSDNNKTPQELSGVGVITGPGGYTGTRAGVSVAKTLSQFLNIPIVGFNKLEAIILSYPENKLIAPMIDIKRNEAYSCIATLKNNDIEYLNDSSTIVVTDWLESLKSFKENLTILNYDFRTKNELFSNLPENITIDSNFYLKPSHIALLADKSITNGQGKKFNEVEPFYVREAV